MMHYQDNELYLHHTITETPQDAEFPFHAHNYHEIYCFLSGQGYYTVEGHDYPLVPGCVLIMRDGEVHKLHISAHCPYERITLHFSPRLLNEYQRKTLLTPFLERPLGSGNILLPSPDLDKVVDMLRRISDKDTSPEENRDLILAYLPAILYEITQISREERSAKEMTDKTPLVGRIIDYINQDPVAVKSMDDVTEKFEASQVYLNRIFRQSTGMSIWEYVLLKRLTLARQAIRNGTPATTAAEMVGYAAYSSFYRQYIKFFGTTPEKEKQSFRSEGSTP